MMKRSFALAAVSACATPFAVTAAPPPIPAPYVPIPTPQKNLPNVPFLRAVGDNNLFADQAGPNASAFSATSRCVYTSKGPISLIAVVLRNSQQGAGGTETAFPNAISYQIALEYPLGLADQRITFGGQSTYAYDGNAPYVISDLVGTDIPAGTQFAIREFQRDAIAPASPSATAASGGNLTASTTYFYKITTVDQGVESYPSSEFSATTGSSGTLEMALTWTAPAYGQTINIYRATASGSERFLASVPATATGWTDAGYQQPAATSAPPSTQLNVNWNHFIRAGESNNFVAYGGSGANVVTATGGISGATTQGYTFSFCPNVILGDDATTTPIIGMGDSRMMGTGIIVQSAGYSGNDQATKNWFDLGLTSASLSGINAALASAQAIDFVANPNNKIVSARMNMTRFAGYVLDELGINDLSGGETWQQLAQNQLQLATVWHNRGQRVILATMPPADSSTDGFTTLSNQSLGSSQTARTNYNNWVRNGAQTSTGLPTGAPCNTAGCGVASQAVYAYWDFAAALPEVNSSGIATANGGYWPIPLSCPTTGTFGSGSTTTSLAAGSTLTQYQWNSYVIQITSGAANGQKAIVSTNSTNSFNVYASGATMYTGISAGVGLTTAPSSGDNYALCPVNTVDGVHPTIPSNMTIAGSTSTPGSWAAFAAALPAFQ